MECYTEILPTRFAVPDRQITVADCCNPLCARDTDKNDNTGTDRFYGT